MNSHLHASPSKPQSVNGQWADLLLVAVSGVGMDQIWQPRCVLIFGGNSSS